MQEQQYLLFFFLCDKSSVKLGCLKFCNEVMFNPNINLFFFEQLRAQRNTVFFLHGAPLFPLHWKL